MRRREEPEEQAYPEGVYGEFAIVVKLDQETGNYMVSCPEWKCEFPAGIWPGERVAHLVDQIVAHNNMERDGDK